MLVLSARQKADIGCVVFSPDGSLIAASAENTPIELWDATGGTSAPPAPSGFRGGVNLCFHPSGRWLFGGCGNGDLAAFDIQNGRTQFVGVGT